MNPIKAVREMKETKPPIKENPEEDYEGMDEPKAEVLKYLDEFVENFSMALCNILRCANRIQKLLKDYNVDFEEVYSGQDYPINDIIESIPKQVYKEVEDVCYYRSFEHTIFELADLFRDNEHSWSQGYEMDDLVAFLRELLKGYEKTKE